MKKAMKVALLLGLMLVAVLAAGIGMAAKKPLPEYVGSQACLGCHTSRWSSWAGSGHGTMVQEIRTPADIPGYDAATPEQQAELLKADFVLSGGRFLARDNATGNLVFLKYEWMHDEEEWIDYDEPGAVWQDRCMGCHITPMTKVGVANQPAEWGIGCENCHGPGREHIVGGGDPEAIVLNASSDVCGVCHNSGYKMADGNRWVYGYRPSGQLAELDGVIMPAVDPEATANRGHHKEYPEWLASAHGPKAVEDLLSNDHASDRCYACHTQEAYEAKAEGETFILDKSADYVAISCVTCHHPHGLSLADEETLCISCHTGSIAEGGLAPGATPHHPMKEFFEGWGAAGGITMDGNVHAEVTCQECHMPNNNHLMQVIAPDDPNLKEGSDDSCTICHEDSREVRAAYLNMWENYTTTKIAALNKDVATIEAAVKAGAVLSADMKTKFDTSKTNILFVEADGSKGAHNFAYAAKILSTAQRDLAAVKAAIGR